MARFNIWKSNRFTKDSQSAKVREGEKSRNADKIIYEPRMKNGSNVDESGTRCENIFYFVYIFHFIGRLPFNFPPSSSLSSSASSSIEWKLTKRKKVKKPQPKVQTILFLGLSCLSGKLRRRKAVLVWLRSMSWKTTCFHHKVECDNNEELGFYRSTETI